MATDAFGNEVPVSPGYKRIIGSDGVPLKEEEKIFLGPGLSATAVEGGTEIDFDSVPAGSVALADMADLTAHSVIGNPGASAAPPQAISATAIGLGVLAAATQAALTALIAVATTSLAGLLSALDKVKLDYQGVRIHNAAYSAAASVTTATWSAGTYRRLKINVRNVTGNTSSYKVAFAGPAAAGYYISGIIIATAVDVSAANQAAFTVTTSSGGGDPSKLEMDANIATDGGGRSVSGVASMATGQGIAFTGLLTETATDITGVTVTFSTASSGWLEVIGYP